MEIIALSAFYEIAAILVLAAAVGLFGMLLRQPLIVSFIVVGILAGPTFLGVVQAIEHVDLMAELGIAVLLFLVGLKLDIRLIRTLGPVALMTGLGQVAFTSIIGFFIGMGLGLGVTVSLYVAVALTFSSTIIIVKLLSDKREIDALHGRIALGFLIVQDLAVVVAMIALSAVGVGTQSDASPFDTIRVLGYGVLLVGFVVLFARYVAEALVELLARSAELLVCFAIGWAALFAALGDFIGFSMELGGLLSGVSLASTRLREAMAARLAPLRDFLLLFFFVALGARLDLSLIGTQLPAAAAFSIFVLIGNPLVVMAIMGAMGYRKRTGFLAGLTVAQISEFSLVFIAMGVTLGHIGADALGLVTLVGIVTISLSTYMITYSHRLYALLEPLLGPFERRDTPREPIGDSELVVARYEHVIFGLGRFGGTIAQRLVAAGHKVLGVDFNPAVVRRWRAEGLDVLYGDATDPEFIASLPLGGAKWAVLAVPEYSGGILQDDTGLALIAALRAQRFGGKIALTSHNSEDWARLREVGADLVLQPFQDASDQAANLLRGATHSPRFPVIEPAGQKDLVA